MVGWLIVNGFLKTEKFESIYQLLLNAALQEGITLKLRTSDSLASAIDENFSSEDLPDFALFWDKDILLARRLELAGVRLFNSADAVENCDNKALTAIKLMQNGIPIPKTIFSPKTFSGVDYNNFRFVEDAVKKLGLPLIIKELYGSFGQQVYLADNLEKAKEIVTDIKEREFLMQAFIVESNGRDLRINVVGNQVVACMLRYNENDFRSNISNGGSMKAYVATEEQCKVAVEACKALNLDFAGVDVLFGADNQPIICEVNSNPHFKSTYECTGVDMAPLIIQYIKEQFS